MLQRLADAGLVKGKTVGIDATTLEANAALRSIVRRDTSESYHDFLTKLAQASGIETPRRTDLARIDRTRKKKGSNADWTHPDDPDAKITKMKNGRTHLAHKAEHAVDLETGAIVGVTVQDADDGDAETSIETLITAAEQIEAVLPKGDGLQEVVGDKGYHSNQSLVDLEAVGVRSYISEPDRGRRNWKNTPEARAAVYRNRRRIRGPRGLRLLRLRGERLERPFAHLYETGGMRAPAGAHEHSEAIADSHGWLQSGAPHAAADWRRHAAWPAGARQRTRGRAARTDWVAPRACDASSADLTIRRSLRSRDVAPWTSVRETWLSPQAARVRTYRPRCARKWFIADMSFLRGTTLCKSG